MSGTGYTLLMRIHSRRLGFTLIEVVVTIFILGVSMTLFAAIGVLLKNAAGIRYTQAATRIAQTKLDELRAGGYEALSGSGPFTVAELSDLPEGAASTTVTAYNDNLKQVQVGVAWVGNDGNERYVSMTTLVVDQGGL